MCVTGCDLNEDFEKCSCTEAFLLLSPSTSFTLGTFSSMQNLLMLVMILKVNEKSLAFTFSFALTKTQQSSEVRYAHGGSV